MTRVLVVIEVNEYEVPMLPDESEETALTRYLDTDPSPFHSHTLKRQHYVKKKEVADD